MLYDLMVNRLTNPIGIDDDVCFSWKMKSELASIKQSVYEIKVWRGENIIWNSGMVFDENSIGIYYDGIPLESGVKYDWSVTVWDNYDNVHTSEKKAYFVTGIYDDTIWNESFWIKEASLEFTSLPVFNYSFNCSEKPISAVLFSTALGNYDIYINNIRVGNKQEDGEIIYDELKPGFTEPKMHAHYQTYDVSYCFDEVGNYNITVFTGRGWWLGRIVGNHETHVMNPNRQGKQIAFRGIVRLDFANGKTVWIKTNKNWKTSDLSPIIDSDIYDGEIIDFTRENNYSCTAKWENVEISNEFNGCINSSCGHNVFVRKDLIRTGKPFLKNTYYRFPIKLKPDHSISVDMGQNIVGWEELIVSSKKDAEITIRHSESLRSDGTLDLSCNRDGLARSIYKIGQGENLILKPLLTYYGFRYLEIETTEEIEIASVKGIVISAITPEMECGTIKTNCDEINKLVENALWSQRGNFNTVPTDCPQRDERHAFTGDVQIYCTTANYFANVYTYIKKWLLEDVVNLQHTDGSYPSTAPQSRQIERYGMAGWSDGGIIIPYKLYLMGGDKEILKKHYPSLKRFMNYLEKNDGPGDHYGDWATPNEQDNTKLLKSFIADAYYCIDLYYFISICEILEKNEEVNRYKLLLSEKRQCFLEKYFNENGLKSEMVDSEGLIYQTACVFVLYFDLIDDKNLLDKVKTQLKNNLEHYGNQLRTGFLGTPLLLPALSKSDLNSYAYKLILQREQPSWLYSILQGATTIWEYWDGKCSQNHFAYGSVAEWLFAFLAGIKPDVKNPAFKHIVFEPQIEKNETISFVKAQYNTPYGYLSVEWEIVDNEFYYDITIPPNTTATVKLPNYNLETKYFISKNGVSFDMDFIYEQNKLVYELNSGKYNFSTTLI
ncbi:family 78 glycoside hydrolase catalytic domain [Methanobrevibacter sp.]|uniref:family 78 glycoside hydrolase catalytic domain n=1 Tax=Methanobrevibacter sp. TaxID=66852 RepID=UPI00388D0C30